MQGSPGGADVGPADAAAWQHGGAVMRRHLGMGSVDLRSAQAGLDGGDLGVIGDYETRHAADGCQRARVGAPIQSPSACVHVAST